MVCFLSYLLSGKAPCEGDRLGQETLEEVHSLTPLRRRVVRVRVDT